MSAASCSGVKAITPCPECGTISSEDYDGLGACWSCVSARQPGTEPPTGNGAGLRVRSADLSRARPPRWAWQDLIVLGYLNLLIGNEGVGKGALITKLIALLTRGALPGDLRGQQVGVGVLGDEDSFDGVWTPRLHAAGADLNLVVQIDRPDGGFVNVREDREKLTRTVREHGLQVLFFDQLLDNLGAGTDDWRQKPIRDALQPLRALARELDIAAVGNLHPNKRATTFRELIAGTVAFNSVSRSSLLLAQHPEDEDVRVLVRGKGNLSQIPPAMEFSVISRKFDANGYTFNVPAIEGLSPSDLTVDDLVGTEATTKQYSDAGEACEIIEALLPRDGAWHPAKPILEACAANEINERTAQRAKLKLGIEHKRAKAFQAPVEWRWPATDDTDPSCVFDVASVASVASANGRKPSRGSSDDTHDTHDNENTRREWSRQWVQSGGWTDDELQTLIDQERDR